MLNFTFQSPTVVHFGKTKIPMLEGELHNRATKVLVVYGQGSIKRNGIYDEVMYFVKKSGVQVAELCGVQPNPRLSKVHEGIELCKKKNMDFILAVGGGSVIDTAKAIAAGVKCEGDVWRFFEEHTGPSDALHIGIVLTLAATGSEMNGNAVITREQTKEKRSCGSPKLIPAFAILNPEYTYTVDAHHTAAGIADIMSHVFENYLSPIPHAMVQDRIAEAILKTCIHYGPRCICEPRNYDARANIMWASTLALNGITGKGKISDWVCHAIEHELSGLYDLSHGVGLAILLPHFMKVFLSDETINNFVDYGVNVWDIGMQPDKKVIANDAIDLTRNYFTKLGLPATLTDVGIPNTHFDDISRTAVRVRGKVGQYTQLTQEQIRMILERAV